MTNLARIMRRWGSRECSPHMRSVVGTSSSLTAPTHTFHPTLVSYSFQVSVSGTPPLTCGDKGEVSTDENSVDLLPSLLRL
jgi:hypothetical protein